MVERFDILILGGGLNGAALALALKDTAYRIALVEAAPPARRQRFLGRARLRLQPGQCRLAAPVRAAGANRCAPRRCAACASWAMPAAAIAFDAIETGLPELAWIAENGRLQAALWSALGAAGHVECITGRPEAVNWGEAAHTLILTDGRKLHANLLVAADGANSWLRRQAGIEIDTDDYKQSGVVANFETEKAHRGIARQWFQSDGILAYLPLPGRRISIVWSSPEERVQERLALSPEDFAEAVARAGSHTLGHLDCITPQVAFPLKRRRARQWVRPGLVLLGDAAHTVHPLAGQASISASGIAGFWRKCSPRAGTPARSAGSKPTPCAAWKTWRRCRRPPAV
jgi:2-octaprenylphenol hydroxylase